MDGLIESTRNSGKSTCHRTLCLSHSFWDILAHDYCCSFVLAANLFLVRKSISSTLSSQTHLASVYRLTNFYSYSLLSTLLCGRRSISTHLVTRLPSDKQVPQICSSLGPFHGRVRSPLKTSCAVRSSQLPQQWQTHQKRKSGCRANSPGQQPHRYCP